ncbi:MAG: amidohydrolase family protein, partial [Patescibacteria group bacterium]
EETGVNLHISHLKAMGEENWPLMDTALATIDKAYERGVNVAFDVYPYTNTGSVLYTLLPDWASEGGRKAMLARLRDNSIRSRIVREMEESLFDYSKIEIAISPINKSLARKKIVEIADSQNKSPEEAVADVLLASEGQVIASMDVLSQENVDKAIIHPLSIVSSNGSGYNLEHADSGELIHPRSFGTFPKVLREYVKEKKLLSWEEAIHKMTWKPAEKFSIPRRGKIKEGFFADVLVIDREKIRDISSKDNPFQYSQGIDFVLVNGRITLSGGEYQGGRFGELILN